MADKEHEDMDLGAELTAEEIAKIKKDARAEVMKELKAVARKELLESEKEKVRNAQLFSAGKDDSGEDLLTLDFQLASYPRYAIIDGRVFHSGKTYTLKRSKIAVLMEMMYRSMEQEDRRRNEKNEFAHMPKVRKVLGKEGLKILPV
jgi:hypothetical protein